jgi:hypothetical protein
VITDHGKRDQSASHKTAPRLPEEQQPHSTRPYQGDQG